MTTATLTGILCAALCLHEASLTLLVFSHSGANAFHLLILVLLALLCGTVHAASKTWASGNGDWTDPVKWTPYGVPLAGDDVFMDRNGTLFIYTVINVPAVPLRTFSMGIGVQLTLSGVGVTV